MTEWVKKLASLADSPVANEIHGLRLLGFFEDMALVEDGAAAAIAQNGVVGGSCSGGLGDGEKKNGEEKGDLIFETQKTREISRSLRECGPFCGEWMEGNVGVWRESGFLMK